MKLRWLTIASIVVLRAAFCFGEQHEAPLSPEESAKQFHVADDLVWEQVLAEPEIAQPVNMKFDERGRLWVVEYRQYPYIAGLKVLSKDNAWRVQYDGVPKAPPHHVRGKDRISIHEDTDGDGTFDRHKRFVDGLNLASSVEIGRGGVWVLNPPYLLFYADKNGDDVPDGDPEVLLEGFGLSDSHSVVNNLTWGPDGWLYAAQGSTVHGAVKRPGTKDEPVHSLGQLIWRYHPETRKYEIFAEGGGNAFGVEIDSKGRIFSGHNGGDTRGFHYVQGGYYQKGFGKHGNLSNPYTFGYFPAIAHHAVPRFTHTFVIYEGGALPDQYNGKLWGVEPLQNQLVLADIEPRGSSFKTKDISRPLTCEDPWFRPVDIKVGPDGAIYVADFYERWPSHREHYDGKVFSNDGRIYRLRAKDWQPRKPVDLRAKSSDDLITELADKNKTNRQIARRVLGDRHDEKIAPQLKERLANETGDAALDYLWALYTAGGLDESAALATLAHENPHVRWWTVRLIADDRQVSDAEAAKLIAMSVSESNVEVRVQLACSSRRLPAAQGLPIVRKLLDHDEDVSDPFQGLSLWWAVEKNCERDRDAVLQLMSESELWNKTLVHNHITAQLMRRFAATGHRKDLLICAKLFDLAPTDAHRKTLLSGFEQAYQGRPLVGLPAELVQKINALGGGSLALRVRGGDAEATSEALKSIADVKTDKQLRQQLVEVFGEVRSDQAVKPLLAIVAADGDATLRIAALGSLQTYNQPEVGQQIAVLAGGSLPGDVGEVARAVLASRASWTRDLLAAIEAGQIKPDSISDATLRKMLLHDNAEIQTAVKKHFGQLEGSTTEAMREQVAKLAAVVASGKGDPYAGRTLFRESCAKCHTLFEEGADIGPNLTSYQRDNIESMLLNVVNPSAEIREGFETSIVVTIDGQVLSGFIADQDEQLVVLRTADGQRQTILREEIEEMRGAPRSIMPEKLLDGLNDQQVRDLFAFLRSRQPVND